MYIEFLGIPRERAGLSELEIEADTLGQALGRLRTRLPRLSELMTGEGLHPSVVANLNFAGGGGQWFWSTRTVLTGNPSKWQNPGGGFQTGFATWGTRTTCLAGQTDPDFAFRLDGNVGQFSPVRFVQPQQLLDALQQALALRDLTDPAQGPHAMQLLSEAAIGALRDAWGWGIAGGAIDIQKVNIAGAMVGRRFDQRR